jgi:hypothetical protein
VALPVETALNRPRQDAVALGQQLLLEVLVAALGRHGDRERDQVQPPLHRFVDVADGGLVVARHEQLELREELEEVLAHEARRDLVATGEVLDLGLGPAPPCSVSMAATKRAPRRPARSVGCRSVRVSMKVSIGALAA